MAEPTILNANIGIPGKKDQKFVRKLTSNILIEWIQTLEVDDYTMNELIKLAEKYPTTALPFFKKNINKMIERIKANKFKENKAGEA